MILTPKDVAIVIGGFEVPGGRPSVIMATAPQQDVTVTSELCSDTLCAVIEATRGRGAPTPTGVSPWSGPLHRSGYGGHGSYGGHGPNETLGTASGVATITARACVLGT